MHRIAIIVCALLSTASIHALSADDFMPPVQAETPEKAVELRAVEGEVGTAQIEGIPGEALQANSMQSAFNAAVQKRTAGSVLVSFPSGYGFVATGVASYQVSEANNTFTRRSRRLAYVKALAQAEQHLAESLKGASVQAADRILSEVAGASTEFANRTRIEEQSSQRVQTATRALLRGYVVYDVYDDTDEDQVWVSIVSSPKTRGKFARADREVLESADLRSGVQTVLNEVQAGVVAPVGGRLITVPGSGEVAVVGFGSSVVQEAGSAYVQNKMALIAETQARARAKQALVAVVQGKSVRSTLAMSDTATAEYDETIRFSIDENGDKQKAATLVDSAHQAFKVTEDYSAFTAGRLPAGVMQQTFRTSDKGEVFAVAVYIPSVTLEAQRAARQMEDADLLQHDDPVKKKAAPVNAGQPVEASAKTPSENVGQGVSGQVTDDEDL